MLRELNASNRLNTQEAPSGILKWTASKEPISRSFGRMSNFSKGAREISARRHFLEITFCLSYSSRERAVSIGVQRRIAVYE
jgi:hypothetical protein